MSAEKVYKNTSSFFTKCINTAISIGKILLRSKFGVRLPKALSDTCIVLGNGPSLTKSFQLHPEFFKKHPLVCVNSFSITEKYTELKPEYYVMLDPGFWHGDNDLVRNTINSIKEKTSWEIQLLVPFAAKRSVLLQEVVTQNPNVKINFFNYTVFKGFEGVAHRFYKKNLAMLQSQNVLVASLFLSINVGFKDIYVVGADHSWHETLHVNENNEVCIRQVHFYEDENKVNYVPFYKGVHTKELFRMDEILHTWGKAFYGYIALNKYANSCNASIFNASEISFIDAFKRVKL